MLAAFDGTLFRPECPDTHGRHSARPSGLIAGSLTKLIRPLQAALLCSQIITTMPGGAASQAGNAERFRSRLRPMTFFCSLFLFPSIESHDP